MSLSFIVPKSESFRSSLFQLGVFKWGHTTQDNTHERAHPHTHTPNTSGNSVVWLYKNNSRKGLCFRYYATNLMQVWSTFKNQIFLAWAFALILNTTSIRCWLECSMALMWPAYKEKDVRSHWTGCLQLAKHGCYLLPCQSWRCCSIRGD